MFVEILAKSLVSRHGETIQNIGTQYPKRLPEEIQRVSGGVYKDRFTQLTAKGNMQALYLGFKIAQGYFQGKSPRDFKIYMSPTHRTTQPVLYALHVYDTLRSEEEKSRDPLILDDVLIDEPLLVEQNLGLSDHYYAYHYPIFKNLHTDRKERYKDPKTQLLQQPVLHLNQQQQHFIKENYKMLAIETVNDIYGEPLLAVRERVKQFWNREKDNMAKPNSLSWLSTHGGILRMLWSVILEKDDIDDIAKFMKDPEYKMWNCALMQYVSTPEKKWQLSPENPHEVIDDEKFAKFEEIMNSRQPYEYFNPLPKEIL